MGELSTNSLQTLLEDDFWEGLIPFSFLPEAKGDFSSTIYYGNEVKHLKVNLTILWGYL